MKKCKSVKVLISFLTLLFILTSNFYGISSMYSTTVNASTIVNSSLRMHFQKPAGWGDVSIYYYDDNKSLTGPTWNSAPAMTSEGNGWYSYDLPADWATAKTRVIFKNGRNQLPGANQPGILVSQETWVYSNGGITTEDPTGTDTIAPTITPNLSSGTYEGAQSLIFTVTDNKDKAPKLYYTTDGTEPTISSTLYTGAISLPVGTTTVKAIGVDATGNTSGVTTLNFVINQNTENLNIHFQKPAGWGTLSIYYYDDNKSLTGPTWDAAPKMTDEGNGWFSYELPSAWKTANTRVMFKDGSNQLPGSQQAGIKVSQQTWVYSDGTTTTTDPNKHTPDITAPTVSISPSSGTYTEPANVTISAKDDRDPSPKIYYTTDGTEPTINSNLYTNSISLAVGTTTVKAIAVDATGNKSNSVTANYTVNKKPITTNLKVHFKKPSGWGSLSLYYYDDTKVLTGPTWDTAPAMTDEGNGWYSYELPTAWKATKVIFKDGTNQLPGAQQAGISVSQETWVYSDGTTTTVDPNVATASATPGTSSFSTSTLKVTLNALGKNITIAKYTLDGSDPMNGITFTNGTQIEIGSDIQVGGTKKLRMYVSDGTNSDSKEFVYTKTNEQPVIGDFKDLRVYQVMVECFQDGDPNVGYGSGYGPSSTNYNGDLKGILKALPYIKSTGANALWMTPIFDSGTDGDYKLDSTGYYARNYFAIDPKFGTFEDAKAIVDKAHELGMYVFFDGVFGHHKNGAAASPSGKYPYDASVDKNNATVKYPESLDFYKEVATYWIDKLEIDGWRLDQCYQLYQNNTNYWKDIRDAVKAKCDERKAQGKQWGTLGYMVGEDWESGGISTINNHSYSNQGLLSAFDFPTHYAVIDAFAKGKSANDLNNSMNAHDYDYPSYADPNLFLDNHDMNRFGNEIGLDKGNQDYWNKYKMAIAFMAAYTGPITLYYGDEIGDKINDYTGSAGDNCSRTTGQITNLDQNQQSMKDYTSAVMKIRDENSALWKGKRTNLKAEYDVYADLKVDGDNKVVYVFNKGGNSTTVSLNNLPGTKLVDLQTGETINISNGNASIPVGRMTSRFLKVQ